MLQRSLGCVVRRAFLAVPWARDLAGLGLSFPTYPRGRHRDLVCGARWCSLRVRCGSFYGYGSPGCVLYSPGPLTSSKWGHPPGMCPVPIGTAGREGSQARVRVQCLGWVWL